MLCSRRPFLTLLALAFIMGPITALVMSAEAREGRELSRDPLPAPGSLRAGLVRLYGVRLGSSKQAVLNAGRARKFLIEDETDSAFDVVYFYRDRAALRAGVNFAAYRIRGGTVDAISLFGRLPGTTGTVPRFEATAPAPLRALLLGCNGAAIRERILGPAEKAGIGGTPPERTEMYRYDGGRIELEYTLYHFTHPRPSTSENCRLTLQIEAS